ncbi:MAG: hypothetical protein AAF251_05155 [Pseudomonadota bacterium]
MSAKKMSASEAVLQRQIRVVMLLDAAEAAGLAPISILRLHTFAYLSNVLAPVWDMPILNGTILKRSGGPFYPDLQRDLDRLVGLGVVKISNVGHVQDEDKRWRLEGSYRLRKEFAAPIVAILEGFQEERRLQAFIGELGYALSSLSDEELDYAVSEDATYSDPMVTNNNVIDFSEWRQRNYSANAARQFDRYIAGGGATPGERIHMYVRHLHKRIQGER